MRCLVVSHCSFSGAFDEDDTIDVVCHGKKDAVLGSIAIPLKDFKTSGSVSKSFPLTSKSKSTLWPDLFPHPCCSEEAASGFIEFDFVVEGFGGGSGAQVRLLPLDEVTWLLLTALIAGVPDAHACCHPAAGPQVS